MHDIVRGFKDILTTPGMDFDFENPPFDPVEFSKTLGEVMFAFGGVGISACQIGVPYRIFAIRAVPLMVFFNPKIVDYSGKVSPLIEGCLSFPGVNFPVKRHDRIRIRYQEPNGEMQLKTFEDYSAHIIQHEFDHTNGILFFDRANRFHRDRAIKNWSLLKKRNGW
mgnify:CR=1 FL=1